MDSKQILLEQMQSCHNETNWFVTVNTALAGLTAEQAAWRDGSLVNSIWQITNHLIFWNRRYLDRFKGIPNPEMKGDNDSTFEGEKTSGTDADWKKTAEDMDKIMSEWEEALKETDEAKLEIPMSKDREGPCGSYIALVTLHSAYHIGQIVTLRKQQGSWDKSKGVN
jgi:uncharacterized damage-inducible protein DinB